jgi:pimeloyl-ACP methyl ester carboxylesterase
MLRFIRILLRIILVFFIMISVLPYFLPIPENQRTIEDLASDKSRFITIQNTKIHYHYYKHGNSAGTVVFLHGFGGSLFSFRDNIDPLLQNELDVLLVDLPGFGLSDRDLQADYSNSGRANLLLEVADLLELRKPVHWVGHSMSGSIIAWLPALDEDAAASLTLVAAPYHTPGPSSWQRTLLLYPPVQRLLRSVFPRLITAERIGSLLRSAYGRPLVENEIMGYMQPLQIEHTQNTLIGLMRDRETAPPDTDAIKLPVLIIWGSKDTWVSPANAPLWHQAIFDSRVSIINDAAHNPMETHTDLFNDILTSFILTDLSSPGINP